MKIFQFYINYANTQLPKVDQIPFHRVTLALNVFVSKSWPFHIWAKKVYIIITLAKSQSLRISFPLLPENLRDLTLPSYLTKHC